MPTRPVPALAFLQQEFPQLYVVCGISISTSAIAIVHKAMVTAKSSKASPLVSTSLLGRAQLSPAVLTPCPRIPGVYAARGNLRRRPALLAAWPELWLH